MSNNKIATYLLYAIGEIILVVVGILIAVSIDDYNQQRKDQKAEQQYLSDLLANLQLQLAEVDGCIQSESGNARYAKEVGDQLERGFQDSDSERLGILLTRIMINRSFNIYNATFEEMKATGNIGLISNQELKSKIISYYQSLVRSSWVLDKYENQLVSTLTDQMLGADILNFDIHFDQIDDQLGSTFLIESGESIDNLIVDSLAVYDFQKIAMENLKSPNGAFRLKNVLSTRYFGILVALTNFNRIKHSTESLKQDIEKELSKY